LSKRTARSVGRAVRIGDRHRLWVADITYLAVEPPEGLIDTRRKIECTS